MLSAVVTCASLWACTASVSMSSQSTQPSASGHADRPEPVSWREAERGILANQVRLTFPDRFVTDGTVASEVG